jgi:hypothetical protein
LELDALEFMEATLDEVALALVSKDGRKGEVGNSELVVEICRCSSGGRVISWKEVCDEGEI